MGCITIDFDRLGSTPTPSIERVGATPTAELDYLSGVPLATLIGLSGVPTSTGTESDAFTTPDKLIVGGYRDAEGVVYPSYIGDIKYFRVYNADGTLALDYQPCKRTSDGVEGFWDCVTQTFIAPRE